MNRPRIEISKPTSPSSKACRYQSPVPAHRAFYSLPRLLSQSKDSSLTHSIAPHLAQGLIFSFSESCQAALIRQGLNEFLPLSAWGRIIVAPHTL